MAAVAAYLDTSALVKLVIREAESEALRRALRQWPRRVSSELAVVELLRVARRQPDPVRVEANALRILAGLFLHPISRATLLRAACIEPSGLRSLDAMHLASALELDPAIATFVAYDVRLQQAATTVGLHVHAPM